MTMNFTQWGLIFNFVGSFFLSLHIIGRERVEKLEKGLKSLPDAPYKYVENIVFKFVQFQINKTDLQQERWKKIYEITKLNYDLSDSKGSFNSSTDDLGKYRREFPGLYYLGRLTLLSFLIFSPVIFVVKIIIGLPLRLILLSYFVKDRLRIESSFGITGIILLFIGFFLQFIGSIQNR